MDFSKFILWLFAVYFVYYVVNIVYDVAIKGKKNSTKSGTELFTVEMEEKTVEVRDEDVVASENFSGKTEEKQHLYHQLEQRFSSEQEQTVEEVTLEPVVREIDSQGIPVTEFLKDSQQQLNVSTAQG